MTQNDQPDIMIIRRKPERFVMIPTDVARNTVLSFEARGLLVYLLSHTDGWQVRMADIQHQIINAPGRKGREYIQRIMKELINAGYVVRERSHDDQGRIIYKTFVYDEPQSPLTGKPLTAKPSTAKPLTANPFTYYISDQVDHIQEDHEHDPEGGPYEQGMLIPIEQKETKKRKKTTRSPKREQTESEKQQAALFKSCMDVWYKLPIAKHFPNGQIAAGIKAYVTMTIENEWDTDTVVPLLEQFCNDRLKDTSYPLTPTSIARSIGGWMQKRPAQRSASTVEHTYIDPSIFRS